MNERKEATIAGNKIDARILVIVVGWHFLLGHNNSRVGILGLVRVGVEVVLFVSLATANSLSLSG